MAITLVCPTRVVGSKPIRFAKSFFMEETAMSDLYEYVTRRAFFLAKVVETDQYGKATWDKPLYSKEFPTMKHAYDHLKDITTEHPYVKGRLVWNDAPHSYHDCFVEADSVFVSSEWK